MKRIKNYVKDQVFPFFYYLITEPFISLWFLIKDAFQGVNILRRHKTWAYVFLTLSFIFIAIGWRQHAFAFLVCYLMVLGKIEMDSGKWKEKQRLRWKKKHEKELNKEKDSLKKDNNHQQ